MRHLVIVNPASCRGDTGGVSERVTEALRSRGLDFELVETQRAGHASEILAERGADCQAVVVVGGDGTLHEAVQSLDLSRHRLGLIPRGSGNDWGWSNGWPDDIESCVERIARGEENRLDIGLWHWNGDRSGRFHNSIGCGFEAAVNAESHRIRRLRGSRIYIVAALRCLLRRRGYFIRMSWEGGTWEGPVLQISLGNGPRVGGTFLLAPEARFDDGLLDICRVARVSLPRALFLLPRTFRGRHVGARPVTLLQTPWIEIAAPEGLPVHVDGEFVGHDVTQLRAELDPGALRTF